MKFRSKKARQESIVIRSKDWNSKTDRGKYAFLHHIKAVESLPPRNDPNYIYYDMRILRTRLNHYYLVVPKPLDKKREKQAPSLEEELSGAGVVALDPGVRVFQSSYDPSGLVVEWGKGDITRIGRLCHAYDNLQSRWSRKNVRHRQRYKMKQAGLRIQLKIRNLIDDVHKRMVSWLCWNYRTILLPSFETSNMVRRGKRRIRSKTARAMLTWAHYRFKQRLLNKAREFPWCTPIICDEHYTSKTCGHCGEIHNGLGGNKIFKCPQCHYTLDRDINGARNILIRYLTLHCNTSNLLGRSQEVALGHVPSDDMVPM